MFSRKELLYALSIAAAALNSDITAVANKIKNIIGEDFIDVLEQFDVRYVEEAFERRENVLKNKIGKNYRSVVELAFDIRLAEPNRSYFGATSFYGMSEKFRQFSILIGAVNNNTQIINYKVSDFDEDAVPLALLFVNMDYDDIMSNLKTLDKDTVLLTLIKAVGGVSQKTKSKRTERMDTPANVNIAPKGVWTKKMTDKSATALGIDNKIVKFINSLARPKGILETDIPKEMWMSGDERWDEFISKEIAYSLSVDKVDKSDFSQKVVDSRIDLEINSNFENFDAALFDRYSNKVACVSNYLTACVKKNFKPGKVMSGLEIDHEKVFDSIMEGASNVIPVQMVSVFFQAFPESPKATTKEYRGIYLESAENIKPHVLDFEYIERLYKNSAAVEGLIRLVGFEEFIRLGAAKNIYATRMALSQGVYDQEILFENKEAFLKLADYDNSPYRKKALLERVRKAVEEVEKKTLDIYDLYAKKAADSFFDSQLPALPKELLHKYFKRVSEYDREHFIEHLKHILNNLKEYNKDELEELVVAKLFEGGKNE